MGTQSPQQQPCGWELLGRRGSSSADGSLDVVGPAAATSLAMAGRAPQAGCSAAAPRYSRQPSAQP
jgi:hypothetical protein